ncbi:MAG: glycosyltransferase, partial [Vicinamibacteria bacterium]
MLEPTLMIEVRSGDGHLDVLYVSYDGLLEPLGRSQVLSYLTAMAAQGLRVGVVSFEKREDLRNAGATAILRLEMESLGILWKPLTYRRHPRPAGAATNLLSGSAALLRLARKHRPGALHARSYLAGIMALAVKTLTGSRFVFDMRGFWPE